jgi:hypothetical protein
MDMRTPLLLLLALLAACASAPSGDAASLQQKIDMAAAHLSSACAVNSISPEWRAEPLERWFDFRRYSGSSFHEERKETYFKDPQAPIYIRPIRGGYRLIIADVEPDAFQAALSERLQREGFEPQEAIFIAVCPVAHNRGKRYCETIGGFVGLRRGDMTEARTVETAEESPLGVSINIIVQSASGACQ